MDKSLIRTTLAAIASTAALIAVSEQLDPPVAYIDTLKDEVRAFSCY